LRGLRSSERKLVEAHTTSSTNALVDAVIDGKCSVSNDHLLRVLDFLLTADARGDEDRRALYFAKANLLVSMQRLDDAVAAYLSAQAISDVYAVPLYLAADKLALAGRVEDARELLREAAAVEETSRIVRKDLAERIYAGIADVYTLAGDDEKAEELYREAMQSMPENPRFHVALAELLLGLERYGESRELLSRLRTDSLAGDPELYDRINHIERTLDERKVH
jgi:tetratricopeptide (TPR) repeat protein